MKKKERMREEEMNSERVRGRDKDRVNERNAKV